MEKYIYHNNFNFINIFQNREESDEIKIIDKNSLQIKNCRIITGSYKLEADCDYVIIDGFYKDTFINTANIKILVVRNLYVKIINTGYIDKIVFLNSIVREVEGIQPIMVESKNRRKNICDLILKLTI